MNKLKKNAEKNCGNLKRNRLVINFGSSGSLKFMIFSPLFYLVLNKNFWDKREGIFSFKKSQIEMQIEVEKYCDVCFMESTTSKVSTVWHNTWEMKHCENSITAKNKSLDVAFTVPAFSYLFLFRGWVHLENHKVCFTHGNLHNYNC